MAYRYEPRSHMVNPKSFGRHPAALWKPYEGVDTATLLEISASYLQHLAACHTLSEAANHGWDLEDLHRRVGKPGKVDTLRRRIYGEAPADFDDIVGWSRAVGDVTVFPAPPDLERMMPPVV